MNKEIGEFVREKRKVNNLRQEDLTLYSGVSSKFINELENGKETLRTDKINAVLSVFGYQLGVTKKEDK